MNHNFKEWTRSAAFHLSLCDWAIVEMLIFQHSEEESAKVNARNTGLSLILRSTSNYLHRRGLIERCSIEGYGGNWVLTDAGRHVAELLILAGFKEELAQNN